MRSLPAKPALYWALPLLMLSGCGSTPSAGPSKEDQALATAQSALAEAKAARAAAEAANAKADQILAAVRAGPANEQLAQQALDSARAARQAADEAQRIAREAQDATARLDTKTDRMFQKSMRK
ncbi:MAG TPA: alanine-zipper protein [Burkholderiales bacterium]|nr:alanine-zipper protein [Burkholderiales bacterium]